MFQCCCVNEDPQNPDTVAVIDAQPVLSDEAPPPVKEEPPKVESQPVPVETNQPPPVETPPVQAPPPKPVEETKAVENVFMATLFREKAEEPLGLLVDFADGMVLHVCGIIQEEDSVIKRYNATAPPERKINLGDYILSINSISTDALDSDGLRHQLLQTSLVLKVCRPQVFDCKITRLRGESLGLSLCYSNSGISLVIKEIGPGVVRNATPQVQVGDRVMAVDGLEGGSQILLQAVRETGETLTIKISRPTADKK